MTIKKIKNQVLQHAKPIIVKHGWNNELLKKISKSSKYNYEDIQLLFLNGYKDLLQLYLDEINIKMTLKSKSINFLRLKVHERIRELIILRLKILSKEKNLISRTFNHLLLPQNYKLSIKNLYKTVDQIWFLAGDNSTDFNFYSKRIILGSIYLSTIKHFIKNDNLNETINLLDKKLKAVSNIPKFKNKFNDTISIIPKFFKLKKNFSFFKR